MKVFINPGHCPGVDSGAVNEEYGVQEATIAYDIGKKVKEYLEKVGIETEFLQSDSLCGENPAYPDVCATANDSNADLFVSLHCNSAENLTAKGTENLIFSFGGEAERAAVCIQTCIMEIVGTVDRGIKERPGLIVLKYTSMPAVLVEMAFISNDEDVDILINRQADMAYAIARGIIKYFFEECTNV